jgi:hypothetical protein
VSASKILCVYRDAPTGSRIGAKNVCHTMREWRAIHANSDVAMRHLEELRDGSIQGVANATDQ